MRTCKMFEDLEIQICCFSPLLSSAQTPWGGSGRGGESQSFLLSATFLYTQSQGFTL
jgi:hypothetical protein